LVRRILTLAFASTVPLFAVLQVASCGTGASPDGGVARLDAAYHPDASCLVTIDTPSFGAATHEPEGTAITYTSNPPAGGPHYPRWASFTAFTTPIPRPYYVHDMEHGAIVLLYKCDADASAPDASLLDGSTDASVPGTCESRAQDFLAKVVATLPTDPTCAPNIRVRTVITDRKSVV
jgi:hypothetical protein